MLANEFPAPLRLCRNDLQALIYEAFAHTFLAGYNTNTISSRVTTSFSRAYQATTLQSFERVEGGRPGFVVATYREPGYDRLLVAVEGTTDRWQLFNGGDGFRVTIAGPGRVWYPAITYSDEIIAILETLPAYLALGNAGQVFDECWAGYSLGAAVAEVSAKRRAASFPTRRLVKAYKFACPRVGNSYWVGWNPINYADQTIYYARDPIDAIPQSGIHPPTTLGTELIQPICFLSANLRQLRINARGEEIPAPELIDCIRNLQAYAELARRADVESPWFDHNVVRYWYALARHARNGADGPYYRFAHLDYEDSNHVGETFGGSSDYTADIWGLQSPAPAPYHYEHGASVGGGFFGGSLGGSPPPNVPVPAIVAQRLQQAPPVAVMQPIAEQVIRPRPNYRPRVVRPTR